MRKSLLTIWSIFTLLVFGSVLIPPKFFEYIGLLGFGIPVVMSINLLFLLIAWVSGWESKWYVLVLVLVAWPFYGMSFRLMGNDEQIDQGIKVMNYNVAWFKDAQGGDYQPVIDWIRSTDADIICFQEFYPLRNIEKRLSKGYFISSDNKEFHTAIYSKYPIIEEGLLLKKDRLNNIRFVDLKVKGDTLRIYNIHFESMGIEPGSISSAESTQEDFEKVGSSFIYASKIRSQQMEVLIEHMETSPHPIIVAGDFNDIPFSNNYFRLRKKMSNAFEKKGSGLGTTYNNSLPFLRIDNQFFSEGLDLISFKTFNKIFYSDHFPLIGIYDISR